MIRYPDDAFLSSLAKVAGRIMRKYQGGIDYELKSDGSPVTKADKEVSELVIGSLRDEFPDISVITEEGNRIVKGSEYVVFCDPVDGTASFLNGDEQVAFSIAVVHNGKPLSAVIYNPFIFRMWSAEKGKGCTMNGLPVRVSNNRMIESSEFYVMWWKETEWLKSFHTELQSLAFSTQTVGSVVYPGGLVASGLIEGTVFPHGNSWEAAAMDLIVTEAGGKFTDLYGNEITYPIREDGASTGCGHVASNGILHPALLGLVEQYL